MFVFLQLPCHCYKEIVQLVYDFFIVKPIIVEVNYDIYKCILNGAV